MRLGKERSGYEAGRGLGMSLGKGLGMRLGKAWHVKYMYIVCVH